MLTSVVCGEKCAECMQSVVVELGSFGTFFYLSSDCIFACIAVKPLRETVAHRIYIPRADTLLALGKWV